VGGFEGIFAASTDDKPKTSEEKSGSKQKRRWKKKGKGNGQTSGYEPVAVPPTEELMKVYTTSLAMATEAFPT
jgi:hypothetical protein